jgi:hypothetical protein
MNNLMGLPNFQINPATRKNRADLLIADAIRKLNKLMSKAPAVIVNSIRNGCKSSCKMIIKHSGHIDFAQIKIPAP